MNGVSILDELKRSWAITLKDIKIYYLRPPALMFGILFPIALFFTFTVGRNISNNRLIPLLAAQTVFWASSSIGPVAIPMAEIFAFNQVAQVGSLPMKCC